MYCSQIKPKTIKLIRNAYIILMLCQHISESCNVKALRCLQYFSLPPSLQNVWSVIFHWNLRSIIIMYQQMRFCFLQTEDLPDILRIVVQANRNTNPILTSKEQTVEAFAQQAQQLIQACFAKQKALSQTFGKPIHMNFGIRHNGELIAVMVGMDMVQWLKTVHTSHRFYRVFKDLNMENLPFMNTVYFQRLSVVPSMMRRGLGKRLVYESAKYLAEQGYQQSVVGCLVQASFKLFMGLGGQLLMEQDVVVPNLTFQVRMISNSFTKLIQACSSSE